MREIINRFIFILSLIVILTNGVFAEPQKNSKTKKIDLKDYNQFLIDQSKIKKHTYKHNKYENIISGSAAFLIGNVGYFTTNSTPLSVAYSGIQTIGILNVGRGAYDLYRPDFEKDLYEISFNYSNTAARPQQLSLDIVKLFAEEARAKRLALLYTSSLLSMQYFANAMIGNQANSLKSIYYFLGSVNLIVVGFSYFHKNPYEAFYYSEKKLKNENSEVSWSILPTSLSTNSGLSLALSWEF